MLLPYLFNIKQGDKNLTKSEISDETYITLKTPVYISVMIFIVGCAISIYGVFNQVNQNSKMIESKLTIQEYRTDRKIDSIANAQFRREIKRDIEIIIKSLNKKPNGLYNNGD